MKNIINKSFLILKNNLIFTQPILIYFLLLLAASQHLGRPNTQLHPPILMALSVFLLAAATISGLFHINKNALSDYNPNDDKTETARKSIKNLKTFFAGTGEHFLKVMSGTMLYSLIFFGFIYTIIIYLTNTIGIEPVQILIKKLGELETANQINEFASSLSRHDLLVINIWSLFFVVSSIVFKYTSILYMAVIVSDKKNIISSFFKAVSFFIKNFFASIFLMAFMFVIYIMINLTVMILGLNGIAMGIFIILLALYFNYYIILVLCFYNERTKADSNNRTECVGQEQFSN